MSIHKGLPDESQTTGVVAEVISMAVDGENKAPSLETVKEPWEQQEMVSYVCFLKYADVSSTQLWLLTVSWNLALDCKELVTGSKGVLMEPQVTAANDVCIRLFEVCIFFQSITAILSN